MFASCLSRDGKVVLTARGIRNFGYGFLSVILAIYLSLIGLSTLLIGLVLTIILVGGAIFTILGSVFADRLGRKKFLLMFALLMAASGLIYALTTNVIALVIASLIGTLSPSGGEVGAFLSIEQAILPQTCSREKRNTIFAFYGMIGQLAGATGALFSGVPVLLQSTFAFGTVESYQAMFAFYFVIAVATVTLYLFLSRKIEFDKRVLDNTDRSLVGSNPPRLSSRSARIVSKLSLLFGVDSFAGGFVLQSLVSYWFFVRFGASLGYLSIIFFISGVLSSISFVLAGRLADRIGLINTMVFTHLPSNILLMLVPFGPNLIISLAFYLARQSISQMDVPTRQAYTVSVVKPEERTIAAGITNISRNTGQAISPSLSGYVMQFVSLSLPFFIAGILKIIYDLTLFANFRRTQTAEMSE